MSDTTATGATRVPIQGPCAWRGDELTEADWIWPLSAAAVAEIEAAMMETIPVRRFASPEEIAAVAVFLASPEAGYVNGANIPVDGGRLAAQ